MPSVFINDGFTYAGTVDGVPGLFPECKFVYRAASPEAVLQCQLATTVQAKLAAEAALIARHYVEFSAIGDDGQWVKVVLTDETTKKLHGGIFRTLANYIMGYIGPNLETEGKKSPGESG